jgi:beta-galactosidase
MPDSFMQQMVAIAEEESPESKLITIGWIDRFYDVFIPARQHANFPDYWKKYTGAMPLFTGEYGDWEYFAKDAGLNQAGYAGLKADERTSRQLRGDGEKRLLQQALNFQEAHNDNLRNPHLGDANWLMYDYNRGYSPDIESSGIMDIFRLPKFAYYFYRSQSQPTLKIATYWNEKSDFSNIKVYSDCEEVALFLNNKLIGKQKAIKDEVSDKLPKPPFIFDAQHFEAGTLKAIGYINNKAVMEYAVTTSGKDSYIKLTYDKSVKPLKADGADVVFVYATVCDATGNPVSGSNTAIQFSVKGNGKLIGQNPISAEAGIATILLQASAIPGNITVEAKAEGLAPAKINITTVK